MTNDLRIADAPLLVDVSGEEKLPTGGYGNYSTTINQIADFTQLKWKLATEGYVNNEISVVTNKLNTHTQDKTNPHGVTKEQVGLGEVDNTADLDKPVSVYQQSAIDEKIAKTSIVDSLTTNEANKVLSAKQGKILQDNKANKSDVLASLDLKADKSYVEGLVLTANGNIINYKTEVELLAFIPTTTNYTAKALDTKKVWLWDGKWNDTGLSELDLAIAESKDLVTKSENSIRDSVVNFIKLPKTPNEQKKELLIMSDTSEAIKADNNGNLKIFGVEHKILSSYSLPLLPSEKSNTIIKNEKGEEVLALEKGKISVLGEDLNIIKGVADGKSISITDPNNIEIMNIEDGSLSVFGQEFNSIQNLKVPSVPSQESYDIYAPDGTRLMSLKENRSLILGFDSSNVPVPITESESTFKNPTFYIKDGVTYKADEHGVSVFYESELINPIGISNNAVLTVVNNSAFSDNFVQSVLTKNGYKFPNPDRVLVIIPFYGQSLSVGSGGLPIYTTVDKNKFPNHVLKFKGFSTIFNRTGSSGTIKVITTDQLTDFDALHATDYGNNYVGQTIADHMGIAIAEELDKNSDGAVMRSLFFCAGVGGTAIDQLMRGSDAYTTMMNAITSAKSIAESKGWSVIVPAYCFQHGESGSGDAEYKTKKLSLYSQINEDIKTITGQALDVHCYLANPAYQTTLTGFRSSQAMYELNRDQHENFTQVGGAYEGEQYDWTHLTTRGYMQLSYRYATAIVEDLKSGFGSYKALYPKLITRTNNVIDIEFNVPNPPLQFKTTDIIPLAENYGFSYVDDSSSAIISSVELLNSTTVRITLSATPSGTNKKIRAGYLFSSGTQSYEKRQRTNLCDSTTGQTPLGDDLNRFCLTFEESIN